MSAMAIAVEPQCAARWYAVKVKSNREKVVAQSLEGKGYEVFLPSYLASRRWSDRVKEVSLPFFPGYVFCRMEAKRRLPILTIPGVVLIVGFGKEPTPVEDHEISGLQLIVRSGAAAEPWPFLKVGRTVRLDSGPLRDLEGILVEIKSQHRLVVSVNLLQRSVAVQVERGSVTPLG